ncbi:MAG: hypothetical protein AAFW68_12350, partial [Pseudomonadota bacterium]
MPQTAVTAIQNDIARAFSVRPEKLFHRRNGQVYAIVGHNRELFGRGEISCQKTEIRKPETKSAAAKKLANIGEDGAKFRLRVKPVEPDVGDEFKLTVMSDNCVDLPIAPVKKLF